MARLRDIGIEVVNAPTGEFPTGNVIPLLHEIRHALQRLVDSGETTAIDLQAIPMAPGEIEEIKQRLGQGEIQATLSALGTSLISETSIPGAWLVEHFNVNDELLARVIEVTRVPDIIRTDLRDLRDGLARLAAELEGESTESPAPD
jgi:hydrogenase-1 operon protein HyaF